MDDSWSSCNLNNMTFSDWSSTTVEPSTRSPSTSGSATSFCSCIVHEALDVQRYQFYPLHDMIVDDENSFDRRSTLGTHESVQGYELHPLDDITVDDENSFDRWSTLATHESTSSESTSSSFADHMTIDPSGIYNDYYNRSRPSALIGNNWLIMPSLEPSAPCDTPDRSQPPFDPAYRHSGVLKGFFLYIYVI